MNICIFGDSIAWGAGDIEGGGWAVLLRNYLYQQNDDIQVYNLGISGDVTTETLKRIDCEATARKVDIIIVALGINDSAFIKSKNERWTSIDQFQGNISLLFEKARKFTEHVFFIGLTPVDETKTMPASWAPDYFVDVKTACEYNEIIEQFCKEKNTPFISLEGVLTLNDLSDGLHPNTEGHRKMFERIKDALKVRAPFLMRK